MFEHDTEKVPKVTELLAKLTDEMSKKMRLIIHNWLKQLIALLTFISTVIAINGHYKYNS